MHRSAAVMIFAALSAASLCGTGCEERVVRTNNTWIGSQYEHAEKSTLNAMPAPEKKGPIEAVGDGVGDVISGTGDLLFGWMDDKPKNRQISGMNTLPDAELGGRFEPKSSDGTGATR